MLEISRTDLEGMLIGGFTAGATVAIGDDYRAVCMDGNHWRIEDRQENVLGIVAPTNCVSTQEVQDVIESQIRKQPEYTDTPTKATTD